MDEAKADYWRQRVRSLIDGTHNDKLISLDLIIELLEEKLAKARQCKELAPP